MKLPVSLSFSVKISVAVCISFIAALGVVSLVKVQDLQTQYSFRDFFPRDHALLQNDEEIVNKYQLEESSSFLVSLTLPSRNQTWLIPQRVETLKKATSALEQLPGVAKVLSLTNLEMALQTKNAIEIGPIFDNLPAKQWKPWVQGQTLLKSQLISEDLRSVVILVEPAIHGTTELQSLSTDINAALNRTLPKKMNVAINIGGAPAVQAQMSSQLGAELQKFLIVSLFLFCGLMFFFYKRGSPLVLALVGLTLTNLSCLAGLALANVSFSVLLSTLPIIVSTTFISLILHTLHPWGEMLAKHQPASWLERQILTLRLLKEMFLANLLGSITTAIGFLTLSWTVIPAIQNYAWTVGATVLWTWLFGQFVLYVALPWTNPDARRWNQARATWILPLMKLSIPIVSLVIAISVVSGATITRLNFSSRLFDDLPAKDPVRVATENIDARFGGTLPLHLTIRSPKEGVWNDPQNLKKLEQLSVRLRELPAVGSVLSVADFIPAAGRTNTTAISEQYFLYSMAAQNPLKNYISPDSKEIRMALRMRDLPSNSLASTRYQMMLITQQTFPTYKIQEAGPALITHALNQSLAKELVYGFWHSLAIIGILLALVFRSVRWALVACLPNFIPPAILMGALAVTQTPVKPGIALVFSIALGLAFNNTVYLLSRLRHIQKTTGMNKLPLRRALLLEGNPCLSESFVLFVGFLAFLLSQFELNQSFGVFMLVSIFAGFIGDLVFLPALLREFPHWLHDQKGLTLPAKVRAPLLSKSLWVLVFLAASLAPHSLQAAPDKGKEARRLLQKARQNLESKSDQATVVLKIIEKNGETKIREMDLKSLKTSKGGKALVRIQSPADVKGTALLAELEGTSQKQWIYLPSTKQIRRITGAAGQGGLLGSELSTQDLSPVSIQSAQARLLDRQKGSARLHIRLKSSGPTSYSHVIITLSEPAALPLKADYFRGAVLAKTVEFSNYTNSNGISRAQLIKVFNPVNKRRTDVELKNIKVNSGLKESDFTVDALKDDF
ncbi:MAG: outer membrane lipoprotein-sorting protein [Bdellovibrio sp.]|jgi:predicted RND superfamily exporter protein